MRVLVPSAARRSHRVIVDCRVDPRTSSATCGPPADKVDVVPLGAPAAAIAAATAGAELRAKLDLGDRARRCSRSRPSAAQEPAAAAPTRSPLIAAGAPARRSCVPGYPTPHEAELRERAAALGIADRRALPRLG